MIPNFSIKYIALLVAFAVNECGYTQTKFYGNEVSINLFRNPSVGMEYRYKSVSCHGGYYFTNFEPGKTWRFIKAGVTYWFLPIGRKTNPSSFYAQVSYLKGLNRDYKIVNAFSTDIGYRAMIWKGLQARLGVIAVFAKNRSVKVNPSPSINYSFFFNNNGHK